MLALYEENNNSHYIVSQITGNMKTSPSYLWVFRALITSLIKVKKYSYRYLCFIALSCIVNSLLFFFCNKEKCMNFITYN